MCNNCAKGTLREGVVLVLSGPSGVGKSTIVKRLLENPGYMLSISATTRTKRPGEEDGREYRFLSKPEFEQWIEEDRFIEYVELFGNYYGTPREPLDNAVREGLIYVLDIDVKGAIRLREAGQDGVYVLLRPPDMEELERRLKGRATEDEEQLHERISHARWELEQEKYYDHIVVNDEIDGTVGKINELVKKRLHD